MSKETTRPYRVALIGDIHGNLPALEAVLAHADDAGGVDAIYNVGDSIGYGPFPGEVLDLLRQRRAISILGNIDRKVLRFPEKEDLWRAKKRPEKFAALEWAWEMLSPEARAYVEGLPTTRRLEVAGWTVMLCHGSPESLTESLFPDTPASRLHELAWLADADCILCGHTHEAFTREIDSTWFVNPGSVGRQNDGDPRARYTLLELRAPRGEAAGSAEVRSRHHVVDYDIQRVVDEIHRQDLPAAIAEMFVQGRRLKWVLEASRRSDSVEALKP